MTTGKQATAKRLKMAERAQQQMDAYFPDMPDAWMWRRKKNDGFTTVPRTLPIVMQAVDAQSKNQPAGHALFCLWARSPDHPLVTIENPTIFAAEAGFIGERAVDTWRRRMKSLERLGLIRTKKGAAGDFHYVLLLNPNAAMEWMHRQNLVQETVYARFVDRLLEIGAFSDIEAIRATWEAEIAAKKAAEAAALAAANPPKKVKIPKPPTLSRPAKKVAKTSP